MTTRTAKTVVERHAAALDQDALDSNRGTWRCLCGWTREMHSDRREAELETDRHVHGLKLEVG